MESADISVNNEMDFDDNVDDEVREVLGADIGVDLEDPSITNTNASSSMKRLVKQLNVGNILLDWVNLQMEKKEQNVIGAKSNI